MSKPILFKAEMVEPILDGRKTQTRRVIKPQPAWEVEHFEINFDGDFWRGHISEGKHKGWCSTPYWKCPYGKPGDELWVRETWAVNHHYDGLSPKMVSVAMGGDYRHCIDYRATNDKENWSGRWRPSIHMPRWASRIQLRITDVRVERVQDISQDDAAAEGVEADLSGGYYTKSNDWIDEYDNFRGAFVDLWNSINEKRGFGWDTNPWVWVVEFVQVESLGL